MPTITSAVDNATAVPPAVVITAPAVAVAVKALAVVAAATALAPAVNGAAAIPATTATPAPMALPIPTFFATDFFFCAFAISLARLPVMIIFSALSLTAFSSSSFVLTDSFSHFVLLIVSLIRINPVYSG